MCVVSMVYLAGAQIPPADWTWPAWVDFQALLQRAQDLDRKLGQPECHDPDKAAWTQEIEERLEAEPLDW